MKRGGVLAWSALAILFTGFGIFAGLQQTGDTGADSPSRLLLESKLTDLGGATAQLSRHKGKPLLVNFWATWCPPCVEEMPELEALQRELGEQVRIVGIGVDSAANIREFAGKHKITYPLYIAEQQGVALSRAAGNSVGGLPFTVLLDAEGKIKKTYLGRLRMDKLRADLAGAPTN